MAAVEFRVEFSVVLKGSVEEVWGVVGNFEDLSWARNVAEKEEREGGKLRIVKVPTPDGSLLEFGDRLLEEPDPRAAPFEKAHSWDVCIHPFGDKLTDVTETLMVNAEGGDKTRLNWLMLGRVDPELKDEAEALGMMNLRAFTSGVVERFGEHTET